MPKKRKIGHNEMQKKGNSVIMKCQKERKIGDNEVQKKRITRLSNKKKVKHDQSSHTL
jgi:hypothetical protein